MSVLFSPLSFLMFTCKRALEQMCFLSVSKTNKNKPIESAQIVY